MRTSQAEMDRIVAERGGQTTEDGRTIIKDHFDDWDSFVACASDRSLCTWTSGDVPWTSNDPDWYGGTRSMEETVDLARNGWREGRERMERGMRAVAEKRRDVRPAAHYDVAGAFPSIPRAVAGDPLSMVNHKPNLRAAMPVVRILFERWIYAYLDPQAIMNYGIALLSYVDALETAGYSVECYLIFSAEGGGEYHQTIVPYKLAGEALDLDRAAFALAHPSVTRRLEFALYEHHPEMQQHWNYYGMLTKTMIPADFADATLVPMVDNAALDMDWAMSAIGGALAKFLE